MTTKQAEDAVDRAVTLLLARDPAEVTGELVAAGVHVATAYRVVKYERDVILKALGMVWNEVASIKGGPEDRNRVSMAFLYDTVKAVFDTLHGEQAREGGGN